MKRIVTVLLLMLATAPNSRAQIFSQDFSSSTVVTDYVNATPNNGQFNAISTSGAGTVLSINGGALQFARTGNAGSFSRTTDFSPVPILMVYKFSLSVSGNTTAQTTAAVFQVGSGFGTANSAESNAATYAKIGINLTTTDGTFQLRDIGGGTNSSNLAGTQNIAWVLNNSGSSATYTDPSGNQESIANDKADVWAGSTKIFDDFSVTTATQTLTDLKFVFNAGTATIKIDNMYIYDALIPLPITLTSFTANASGQNVTLNWNTASEAGTDVYEVQELVAGNWTTVRTVSAQAGAYSEVFSGLSVGTHTFRLKTTDQNGQVHYSKTLSATVEVPGTFVMNPAYPNPFNPQTTVTFAVANKQNVTMHLYNVLGQRVATLFNGTVEANNLQTVRIESSNLQSGTYLVRLVGENFTGTQRITLVK